MTTFAARNVAPVSIAPVRSVASRLPTVVRCLMGLAFFVFGLDGFLAFIPRPTEPGPAAAAAFGGALYAAGYMIPLIKGTELVVGLLLLSNRFVPLALALIAPVLVNIVAFHAFLAPAGVAPGLVLLAFELYLAWSYRAVFMPMLTPRALPGRGDATVAAGA